MTTGGRDSDPLASTMASEAGPEAADTLAAGERLGRDAIVRRLGAGAMGVVTEASPVTLRSNRGSDIVASIERQLGGLQHRHRRGDRDSGPPVSRGHVTAEVALELRVREPQATSDPWESASA